MSGTEIIPDEKNSVFFLDLKTGLEVRIILDTTSPQREGEILAGILMNGIPESRIVSPKPDSN